MIPEQELKDRCTPEFIKRMVELAEGFEIKGNTISYFNEFNCSTINIITSWMLFPLLIHRAVEHYIKRGYVSILDDGIYTDLAQLDTGAWLFKNYQSENLTQCECACLHCLIDIFEEKRK